MSDEDNRLSTIENENVTLGNQAPLNANFFPWTLNFQ